MKSGPTHKQNTSLKTIEQKKQPTAIGRVGGDGSMPVEDKKLIIIRREDKDANIRPGLTQDHRWARKPNDTRCI